MDRKGIKDRLRKSAPGIFALAGIVLGSSPWLTGSLYRNSFVGAGIALLFLSWIWASFNDKTKLIEEKRWANQKKAMVAMAACLTVGLGMLAFYEAQMPKYEVAKVNKELYRVPPQLNKRQLRELGAECNTYGNTLCSHDVFAKIVNIDPRDYLALANLAMAQSHLGFHQYAVVNFNKAIQNGVRRYDVYKFYGHSLVATGDLKKAVVAYKASLNKNPNQQSLRKKIREILASL